MKFINFAIVKLSVFLVLGILVSHFFPSTYLLLPFIFIIFFIAFLLWIWSKNQFIQTSYFGISVYICFFSLGYFSYQIRLPKFQPEHYSHIDFDNSSGLIQLKIRQTLKPDKYNYKYLADVNIVNGVATKGKILLNLAKDSLQTTLSSDTTILVYGSVLKIPEPLNPHQFDYSKYMESLEVYGQLRISTKKILRITKGNSTLIGVAENFRTSLVEKLKHTKLKADERSIIQALVLGDKKDIDKDLYNEYAAAGAVHILAVSGLHVGILYIILTLLFKPLTQFKHGMLAQSIFIVILLWAFAIVSGLSPSVTRAVTMFSFFALAKILNRETNAINTLFLSFLTLLIINPLWLFQVGFQLSYLAVFFIVWLQPKLFKIGYSKYWILRKTWGIISVTICAQIGVLPLSLYYFHQFPGLFLITNIVILPFLAVLMFGGILIVFLTSVGSLPDWLAEAYNFMIESLNSFIHWIAVQENYLIKGIHFSELKTIGAYFLIIALAFLFKKPSFNRLVFSLVAISLLTSIYIYDEFNTSSTKLLVFQKTKQTLIGYKNGKSLTLFSKDPSKINSDSYPIKSFKTAMNINKYSHETLPEIFQHANKKILIVDSLGIVPKSGDINIIVLTNSPKINLSRIIDSLNPEQIIADGSNYISHVIEWEHTCKLKKLPFYHTAKQGAFLIK